MPELPEVESFVRALRAGRNLEPGKGPFPSLSGSRIVSISCDYPPLAQPNLKALRSNLAGARIEGLGRRGKLLVFALDSGFLTIHLRMSGRLYVLASKERPSRRVHLSIKLDSGYSLHFDDARKFGRATFLSDLEALNKTLGPEPLSPAFSRAVFQAICASSRRAIKQVLLDQGKIAGIGNIYSDEALWRASIHPSRPASSLSPPECARLRQAIRFCLRRGIARGGAAIDWVYPGGKFQEEFKVYGQEGKPCPRCGSPIRRYVLGQRGTRYCPGCQSMACPATRASV